MRMGIVMVLPRLEWTPNISDVCSSYGRMKVGVE